MKLCFSTLPCPQADAQTLVKLCRKYQIGAVELRLNAAGEVCQGADDPSAVGQLFADSGIAVADIASGVSIKRWDDSVLALLHDAVDTAAAVKANAVRVFLGNCPDRKSALRETLNPEGIVKMLQEGCDYAVDQSVRIWIETHGDYATGAAVSSLLEKVNRSNAGVIWDIMHSLEEGETIEETISILNSRIEHVHVKDGKPYEHDDDMIAWYYTRMGKGVVPIKQVIRQLNQTGYDGWYSLEWETAWRKELRELPNDMDWILSEFIREMTF